jgi:hypothetical protein
LQESGAEADALQGAVEVEEVAAAGGTAGRETHYPPGLGPVDGGWDDAPALQKGVFFTTAEFQQYAAGCKQPLPERRETWGDVGPDTPGASAVAEGAAATPTTTTDDDGTSSRAVGAVAASTEPITRPPRQRYLQLKYCHGFAELGKCRDASSCLFPHLTYAAVQAAAAAAALPGVLPQWAHRAESTSTTSGALPQWASRAVSTAKNARFAAVAAAGAGTKAVKAGRRQVRGEPM